MKSEQVFFFMKSWSFYIHLKTSSVGMQWGVYAYLFTTERDSDHFLAWLTVFFRSFNRIIILVTRF